LAWENRYKELERTKVRGQEKLIRSMMKEKNSLLAELKVFLLMMQHCYLNTNMVLKLLKDESRRKLGSRVSSIVMNTCFCVRY
jgi:hypothetical protein